MHRRPLFPVPYPTFPYALLLKHVLVRLQNLFRIVTMHFGFMNLPEVALGATAY